jgi:hypothetical protein
MIDDPDASSTTLPTASPKCFSTHFLPIPSAAVITILPAFLLIAWRFTLVDIESALLFADYCINCGHDGFERVIAVIVNPSIDFCDQISVR